MVMAEAFTREETEAFLLKATEVLDSLDDAKFPDFFAKDVVHRSGLQEDRGLETFTGNLKQQLQMLPPLLSMRREIERIDIAHDGLIYASGRTTMVFKAEPDLPVRWPAMGMYTRVPQGQANSGKISTLAIYEDHAPLMQKLQMMAGQK